MIKFLLILFVTAAADVAAQPESSRWNKIQADYLFPVETESRLEIDTGDPVSFTFTALTLLYQRTFSDYDGDNCPFYPSCSSFFAQSVSETNVLSGTLSFFDRFTRDSNFFKSPDSYSLYKNKKFYDPVSNYTLDASKIEFRGGRIKILD